MKKAICILESGDEGAQGHEILCIAETMRRWATGMEGVECQHKV